GPAGNGREVLRSAGVGVDLEVDEDQVTVDGDAPTEDGELTRVDVRIGVTGPDDDVTAVRIAARRRRALVLGGVTVDLELRTLGCPGAGEALAADIRGLVRNRGPRDPEVARRSAAQGLVLHQPVVGLGYCLPLEVRGVRVHLEFSSDRRSITGVPSPEDIAV